MIIDPKTTPTPDLHQYLLGAVSPRPIALASTVDKDGNPNIAPYSFFNCFSSNPPIVVFSSNRKVADNTTKDTLHNIKDNMEVVINVVPHSIVHQMALSSVAYPPHVNEFEKAGLTAVKSDLVKPLRVKESPVNMECKVQDIIPLGEHGGAGHLIICLVVRMHIDENILDEDKKIDPHKIDLMGRMGRAYYTRASGDSISKIYQNVGRIPLGYDQLPDSIKQSKILSANDIAQLAGQLEFPNIGDIEDIKNKVATKITKGNPSIKLHTMAKQMIEKGEVVKAFSVLMMADSF